MLAPSNFSVLNLIDSRLHINFVDQVVFFFVLSSFGQANVCLRIFVYAFAVAAIAFAVCICMLFFSCKWATACCLPTKIEYNLIFNFSFIRFFFSTSVLLINRIDTIIFSQFHQQWNVQRPNCTTNETETCIRIDCIRMTMQNYKKETTK